ncbi:MAG: VanZ family protein [Candidatus Bipolaricaulota bacterium]|nr:MAG: VanZ family protein [Candidatus Bipolaricaulota bacterium]
MLLTSFVVRRRSLLASGAVSLVTGGAIEIVQLLVATRTASLSDVVADAAGIVAGIAMISLCRRLALAKCPGRRILSRDPETRKEGETCTSGESRSSGRASSS